MAAPSFPANDNNHFFKGCGFKRSGNYNQNWISLDPAISYLSQLADFLWNPSLSPLLQSNTLLQFSFTRDGGLVLGLPSFSHCVPLIARLSVIHYNHYIDIIYTYTQWRTGGIVVQKSLTLVVPLNYNSSVCKGKKKAVLPSRNLWLFVLWCMSVLEKRSYIRSM